MSTCARLARTAGAPAAALLLDAGGSSAARDEPAHCASQSSAGDTLGSVMCLSVASVLAAEVLYGARLELSSRAHSSSRTETVAAAAVATEPPRPASAEKAAVAVSATVAVSAAVAGAAAVAASTPPPSTLPPPPPPPPPPPRAGAAAPPPQAGVDLLGLLPVAIGVASILAGLRQRRAVAGAAAARAAAGHAPRGVALTPAVARAEPALGCRCDCRHRADTDRA